MGDRCKVGPGAAALRGGVVGESGGLCGGEHGGNASNTNICTLRGSFCTQETVGKRFLREKYVTFE